jgi:hypothetical protein
VKSYVTRRLLETLDGKSIDKETDQMFAHLTAADRSAIREILQDTKPDLFAK